MRVLVVGATGAVGKPLVRQLIERGHQVTATTRNLAKADALRRLGASPVALDGLNRNAVGEAVAAAKPAAIIHQMTSLAGKSDLKRFDRWFAATNMLRTRGTDYLLAAARAAGVERFIAQSYTGWNNMREGGPVKTEDDPLDARPAKAQVETLSAIRYVEHEVLNSPLVGSALRFGNLYGPGASEEMIRIVRNRMLPIVGSGGGVWSWIHVDDAARATVLAIEHGARGIYNIVDDEPARVSEWLPSLAAAVGAKPPFHVPPWLGRMLAGQAAVQWMIEGRGASNAKAKRELGWDLAWPSWREGFRRALARPPGMAG